MPTAPNPASHPVRSAPPQKRVIYALLQVLQRCIKEAGNSSHRKAEIPNQEVVGTTLGLQLHLIDARSTSEIDNAFAEAVRLNASAMVVGTDPFFSSNADLLATLMLRYRLPTVYQYREFTAAGGTPELRWKYRGRVSHGGHLHWPDTQWRKTGGHSCRSCRKARADNKSKECQVAWALSRPAVSCSLR